MYIYYDIYVCIINGNRVTMEKLKTDLPYCLAIVLLSI